MFKYVFNSVGLISLNISYVPIYLFTLMKALAVNK